MFNKQPMRVHLSGLELEYNIIQIYSKDAGKREAKLTFDVGQGSQDLGFRNEVDILFTATPSAKVTLQVRDFDGKPTTGSFLIRDARQRVYPSQTKRLGGDFSSTRRSIVPTAKPCHFRPALTPSNLAAGPEYLTKTERYTITGTKPVTLTFQLQRWIDPAKLGWYSG